ncbi:endonuclease [Flavobacterium sp. 14A]|uniref:endonuclease n=1 Tax=Flavobacterium sp. 14A TaxID=2735896 RepID=UPI001570FE51|nr:endonuclease [Flavobacterium sp. 14A]NRT12543.1 endonuclease I [Flavobacterium sp. 14A]
MKKLYTFILIFSITTAIAQIPSGYYNSATSTGYSLKTQLYNIIKNHSDKGYNGLYTTYQTSDVDNFYEKDGTVLDMYSEKPNGSDPYTYATTSTQRCGTYSKEGDCYNREHIVPQSTFNSSAPMVSDAHFITPTDGKVNGQRSNYPHGTVATSSWTSLNGSKLGTSSVSGYSGTVFEPIDEFKGDIARMYFYFATRYETTVNGYSYLMFNGTNNQVFTTAFLNMLLSWNALDPVSPREIARNNAIYAIQNNRNPYIDHPEYVQKIWSTVTSTANTFTDLYISEYIEGSSNNKALEIANATAGTINLSGYSIRKQTNGSGAWSSGINLTGSLTKGSKYTIVNSAISSSCYSTAASNISTSANEMTFNGNDPVGLFKNGVLIDIIGLYNGGSANFAADVTLRRKSTATGPKTTFNKSNDWDIYSSDICSNLGARIAQITSKTALISEETMIEKTTLDETIIYPNPSLGDIVIYNSSKSFTVIIYNLVGQVVFKADSSNSNTLSVKNIPKGMHIVKVSDDTHTSTKKIVIN